LTIQDHPFPPLNAAFPASDAISLAPAVQESVSVKRVMDLALSLAAILLLSPLFAAIAMAVRLDSRGPVFFRQRRTGRLGQIFSIYKFRTMHVLEDGAAVTQARAGDRRITRLGRFLRVASLDELPQFFNVLAGDMSLVGPRPHAIAHDEFYAGCVRNYRLRQLVKPGITGWAQVHGARGATPNIADMQARIDLDLHYIARESLWLDLCILARTPMVVLRRRNAV
jgi:undecaprenyl-phosphate glucose phosphotransferase